MGLESPVNDLPGDRTSSGSQPRAAQRKRSRSRRRKTRERTESRPQRRDGDLLTAAWLVAVDATKQRRIPQADLAVTMRHHWDVALTKHQRQRLADQLSNIGYDTKGSALPGLVRFGADELSKLGLLLQWKWSPPDLLKYQFEPLERRWARANFNSQLEDSKADFEISSRWTYGGHPGLGKRR